MEAVTWTESRIKQAHADLLDIRPRRVHHELQVGSDSGQSQGRRFHRSDTHRCDYNRHRSVPAAHRIIPLSTTTTTTTIK